MQSFPLLSRDLIKKLDEAYPLRLPDPKDTDRMVWIKVGQRMVVDQLVHLLKVEDEEGGTLKSNNV